VAPGTDTFTIFSFLVSGTGEVLAPWHLAPTLSQLFHFFLAFKLFVSKLAALSNFLFLSWQRLQAERVF